MRIIEASAQNFQSYQEVAFQYCDLGLALLSGETKAGKSTILDLPCWILFGTTSKDSAADDVKSWFADGVPTIGTCCVEIEPGVALWVTRIRGKRSSDNDLFYFIERNYEAGSSEPMRGKDANDTQKQIEDLLGVDADLYISGCYLHQFSKADSFFVAKAKDRRETLERIADLSLPIMLGERASESRKQAKKDLEAKQQAHARLEGKLDSARSAVTNLEARLLQWGRDQAAKITLYEDNYNGYAKLKAERIDKAVAQIEALAKMIEDPKSFDVRLTQVNTQLDQIQKIQKQYNEAHAKLAGVNATLKAKQSEYERLSSVEGTCPTCLGPADNDHKTQHLANIEGEVEQLVLEQMELETAVKAAKLGLDQKPKLVESYETIRRKAQENQRLIDKEKGERDKLAVIKAETNPHAARLEELRKEENPYSSQMQGYCDQVDAAADALQDSGVELTGLAHRVSALTWLYDKSYELRGALLSQAVKQIQDLTNDYLERYFDAELRVKFTLADSDKLEVLITNDGYDCPYKQLSGGERAMLKLAFSVGYMRLAEDQAGIKFSTLMLDEAMNGLDANLKLKAFSLLQSLESNYDSILLIDHEEAFKQMFSKRFLVEKRGAYSYVEELDAD